MIPGDSLGLLVRHVRLSVIYFFQALLKYSHFHDPWKMSLQGMICQYWLVVDLHMLSSVDSCSPVVLITCKCLLF